MFSKWLPLILAFAAFSVFPSAFAKGGKDGGGGSTRGSTPAEVYAVLKAAFAVPENFHEVGEENLYGFFFDVLLHRTTRKIPAGLNPVLDKMFQGFQHSDDYYILSKTLYSIPIAQDLKNSKVKIRMKGPCRTPGSKLETSASTEFSRNADICLSMAKLTMIPKADLPYQIRALLVHELTHHFGYGEKEANLAQNFALNKENTEDPYRLAVSNAIWALQDAVQFWVDDFEVNCRTPVLPACKSEKSAN